jgi:hypothetical protein
MNYEKSIQCPNYFIWLDCNIGINCCAIFLFVVGTFLLFAWLVGLGNHHADSLSIRNPALEAASVGLSAFLNRSG